MMITDISPDAENKCHQFISELTGIYTEAGCVDLDTTGSIVNKYSGTLIPLVKPKSYHVRVCGQDDTVYAGNEDQLEAWEDHYLSERMRMTVIGAIDDFPCEAFARQLVLLLCEDGNIYAYEDEVLHLVAESLKDLFENGMTFPGIESYNLGECFEEYTEEEYNELMECSEMKEMREAHEKFRESLGLELLECLEDLEKRQIKMEKEAEEHAEHPSNTSDTTAIKQPECLEIVSWQPVPIVSWSSLYQQYNSYLPMRYTLGHSIITSRWHVQGSETLYIKHILGGAAMEKKG
ncbi:uncharacterized protein LOC111197153 isoform X1 [Astyanax mexicanus]|uniref:uncharacterized protein LOC111197153 isoform X1 n=1 Tax=Astyanax mexicanus TaxID=7994 RepID=UPI0020CAA5A8|nr:uncharacterized protein LOC111197153 isoform X1 [Astyanax mexicanus]